VLHDTCGSIRSCALSVADRNGPSGLRINTVPAVTDSLGLKLRVGGVGCSCVFNFQRKTPPYVPQARQMNFPKLGILPERDSCGLF
jgi:hypothetical protein